MADSAIAAKITELKALWTEKYNEVGNKHLAPGKVVCWCPVDKDSAMKIIVPGRVVRFCGFTTDQISGDSFKQLKLDTDGETTTTSDVNRRGGKNPGMSKRVNFTGRRMVWINIKNPVKYTIKGGEKTLRRLRILVPEIISWDCLTYFFDKMSSETDKPTSIESAAKIYPIITIEQDKLGSLTDKVQKPQTEQPAIVDGAAAQPPTPKPKP